MGATNHVANENQKRFLTLTHWRDCALSELSNWMWKCQSEMKQVLSLRDFPHCLYKISATVTSEWKSRKHTTTSTSLRLLAKLTSTETSLVANVWGMIGYAWRKCVCWEVRLFVDLLGGEGSEGHEGEFS